MTHGEMNGHDDPNRRRRLCRTAGRLAVLLALGGTFLPRAARAREIAATEADLGGRVRVSVLSEADGVFVAIERSGGPPVRQRLPLSAPASSIVAEATTVELTGGRAVLVTYGTHRHVPVPQSRTSVSFFISPNASIPPNTPSV